MPSENGWEPGTAKASFTSEVQINDTAGMGVQAHIPPDFFPPNPTATIRSCYDRGISLRHHPQIMRSTGS